MLARLQDFFARPKLGEGLVVEIYGKPDCHLCEVAKQRLAELQQRWRFELREVNIANDPNMLEEYGTRIPLIWVAGKLACKYHVEEEKLRQRLQEAAAKRQEDGGSSV